MYVRETTSISDTRGRVARHAYFQTLATGVLMNTSGGNGPLTNLRAFSPFCVE